MQTKIDVYGWKGQGDLSIEAVEESYIVKEHRKCKESGDVETVEHVIPKKNVEFLWDLLKTVCEPNKKYSYKYVVSRFVDFTNIHEQEGLTKEQMVESFNGGRNRARWYFPHYYYPIKILENLGKIKYFGRGGVLIVFWNSP